MRTTPWCLPYVAVAAVQLARGMVTRRRLALVGLPWHRRCGAGSLGEHRRGGPVQGATRPDADQQSKEDETREPAPHVRGPLAWMPPPPEADRRREAVLDLTVAARHFDRMTRDVDAWMSG